jgi:NitT/TauT family transport system permease protein
VPVLGYISLCRRLLHVPVSGSGRRRRSCGDLRDFTSQAWNMTFSFYQSLRTVPRDLEEAT